jgi:hypothetical protein
MLILDVTAATSHANFGTLCTNQVVLDAGVNFFLKISGNNLTNPRASA